MESENSNIRDYTKGNLSHHLLQLAIPLVFGNILQEFYNTIDAFVVGRFAGQEEFAAIGIAGTVMNLFLFALVGCCTGFSVLFARAYGQADMKELRKQHFSAHQAAPLLTQRYIICGWFLCSTVSAFSGIHLPDITMA